jgi:hypothetical protein
MANKVRVIGEGVLDEIIYRYLETESEAGEIAYSSIRDFALALRLNNDPIFTERMYYQLKDSITGELSEKIYKNIKLSDDFWRKPEYQGRQKVDKRNRLLANTVAKATKNEIYQPNVAFIIESNKYNTEQLKKQLMPLEGALNSSYEKIKKLEKIIIELEAELSQKKQEKNDLKLWNDKLQDALFKFFEFSAYDDIPLSNQVSTGKGRTNLVEATLKEAFNGDPRPFYTRFNNKNISKDSKITNINDVREHKNLTPSSTFADEYDFD